MISVYRLAGPLALAATGWLRTTSLGGEEASCGSQGKRHRSINCNLKNVLCIWPGPPSELDSFMKYLNQSHPTIKFTHENSIWNVDFLDVTIYKGLRYAASLILDLKPFFKPTNKFQYLEYNSAHPKNTFSNVELTRLLRACSDEETYKMKF